MNLALEAQIESQFKAQFKTVLETSLKIQTKSQTSFSKLIAALMLASILPSFAMALPNRTSKRMNLETRSPLALNQNDLINQIVVSVVERPRVLVGTTNAERALGSTTFSLPMIRESHRAELRANLRANSLNAAVPYGVSSNPEAFHMDVNYVAAPQNSLASAVRLNYRGSHTTPAGVSTRILTYDAPVTSSLGTGRLVATVQQRAMPEQRLWKTTATFLRFVPN